MQLFLVIDSNGFFPHGIIDGSFTSLGEYDQCISIQIPGELVKRNKEKNPDVHGKYCLSKLHLTKYNLMNAKEKNRLHKQYSARLKSNGRLSANTALTNDSLAMNAINWSSNEEESEDSDKLNNKSNEMLRKLKSNKIEPDKFKYNGTVIQNTVFENVSRLGLDFFQHIHAFRIGICAPSTCTNSDINIFLNKSKSICLLVLLNR